VRLGAHRGFAQGPARAAAQRHLASASARSAGTSTGPPGRSSCRWRGAAGRGTRRSTRPDAPSRMASSSGSRRPTATEPVAASATTPSGRGPTCTTSPAGGCLGSGARAGSAARGVRSASSEPQPATEAARTQAIGSAREPMRRGWQTPGGRLASRARSRGEPRRRSLPWTVFAAGAVVVAVGLRLERTGTALYVPNPPFLWRYEPRADVGWIAASVLVLLGAVALGPRLVSARIPTGAFLLLVTGLTAAWRLSVSAARGGSGAWDAVFDRTRSFEADNEYLPALPALRYGVDIFLDRFSEVVTSLPVHAAGHPPGLLLVVHALGIDSPPGSRHCASPPAPSRRPRVPPRPPAARGGGSRPGGRPPARAVPGGGDVRRDVRGRALHDARRARGARAGPHPPCGGPRGAGGRFLLRVVAAGGRGLGGRAAAAP
jgi:hypothetical protein